MAISLTNYRTVSELSQQNQSKQESKMSLMSPVKQGDDIETRRNDKIFQQQQVSVDSESFNHSKYSFHHKIEPPKSPSCDMKSQAKNHHTEPFEIRWTNLTYQVEPKWYRHKLSDLSSGKSRRTTILNGLSGSVRSGQVTAILGPSGAGKTSLLGCLLGKHRSGVSGCVQVISERLEPMSICTIPQKGLYLYKLDFLSFNSS